MAPIADAAAAPQAADIRSNPFKRDFPLLASHPGLAYLDSAATAQRPAAVLDAQRRFYETMNANPLRGLYGLSVAATEAVEGVRARAARFVGATDPGEVVFVRNASEALNLAAWGISRMLDLGPGDEVCVSVMEHHSNLVPWQQACERTGAHLVYLRPRAEGGGGDFAIAEEELAAKIGPRTRVVAIAHVSNVLGVVNPVRAIADRAHGAGALVVVDAAQSAPHIPLDVAELGCDALALSAHKLMGPLGVGVLWGRRGLLEGMPPFLTGGEMIEWVREDGAAWAPVPHRFETGTQDAAGVYAFGAALDYLEGVGFGRLRAREEALMAYLVERLAEVPGVELVGPAGAERRVGVVSFNLRGVHPHDVASLLDAHGVAIRAGHHCAQPLLAWLGVGSCCRASVALYNDATDIDRLAEALEDVRRLFHGGN